MFVCPTFSQDELAKVAKPYIHFYFFARHCCKKKVGKLFVFSFPGSCRFWNNNVYNKINIKKQQQIFSFSQIDAKAKKFGKWKKFSIRFRLGANDVYSIISKIIKIISRAESLGKKSIREKNEAYGRIAAKRSERVMGSFP